MSYPVRSDIFTPAFAMTPGGVEEILDFPRLADDRKIRWVSRFERRHARMMRRPRISGNEISDVARDGR